MKGYLGIGTLLVCLVPFASSIGRTSGPPVYVSLMAEHRIAAVDAATGAVSVIYSGDADFRPEELVVGPDEKIYVADSSSHRIWRLDQDGRNMELVYEPDSASIGNQLARPHGLSFGPDDTLYLNGDGGPTGTTSGVWRLVSVAAIDTGDTLPLPEFVTANSQSGFDSGAGTSWSLDGRLLVADSSGRQVSLSSATGDSSPHRLIDLTNEPRGIAVNHRGEIFVALSGDGGIWRYDSDGSNAIAWARLDPGSEPTAIETDALGNLWVTARRGRSTAGALLRIDKERVVSRIATFDASAATGVAVPATAATIHRPFAPEDPRRIFDFGNTRFVIEPSEVIAGCDVSVTAIETPPEIVNRRLEAFYPQASCVRYGSKGGDCVVYRVQNACFSGATALQIEFFSDAIETPGFLHDPNAFPGDFFAEDVLTEIKQADTTTDGFGRQVMRARTNGFSDFVAVDLSGAATAPTKSAPSIDTTALGAEGNTSVSTTLQSEPAPATDETDRPAVAPATILPGSDPSGIASDDFNGCDLDPTIWTLVDPLGGATAQLVGGGTGSAQLELFIPGGASHNPWTSGNDAARLMQPVSDADFEIETKIDSSLTQTIQNQGLLVEQDADHFLRFDAYRNGSTYRLFGAVLSGSSASTKLNLSISSAAPLYLRVSRVGSDWTLLYSFDAQAWVTATTFSNTLVPTQVGLLAGNFSSSGNSAPEHTAIFDYFFNTAIPIVDEDLGAVPADLTLDVTTTGNGTVQATPSTPTYACGTAVSLDAIADPGHEFVGWTGDISSADNPLALVMTSNVSLTATFAADLTAPVISNVQVSADETTAQITWDTDEPASTRVDFGETTGYGSTVEDLTLKTSHIASLTGLNGATEYHFQITSIDLGGTPAVAADQVFTTDAPNIAPVISNLQVAAGDTTAQITWDTDEPATSRVDFGTTTGYGSVVEDLTPKTSHTAALSGLTVATLYHFQVTSADPEGLPSVTVDQVFTTLAANVAPVISNVVVTPGETTALVTWDTDEPATSRVDFGETTGYGTVVEDLTLTTSHVASLTGMSPSTQHHFQLTSTDVGGLADVTLDDVFTTSDPVVSNSGVVSDDFNSCAIDLNSWTLIDPLGSATAQIVGAGTGDAQLELFVPPGPSHRPWTQGNTAVRLMRAVNDTDFEFETKLDSALPLQIQSQGLLVEESATRFLRFDAFRRPGGIRVFAALVSGNSVSIKANVRVSTAGDVYLRIARIADDWTVSYSLDGQAWVTAGTFNEAFVPTQVGLFAGNHSTTGVDAPAHTALFDYFFDTSSPIANEDQGAIPTDLTLDVTTVGNGTVQAIPSAATYLCGETITLDAIADPGHEFVEWTGDVSSTDNPLDIVITKDMSLTATFAVGGTPPVISNVQVTPGETSAQITWDTDEPATSRVDFGETTGYGSVVEDLTLKTSHSAALSGLTGSTQYHYQITSDDAGGTPAVTADQVFTTQGVNVPPVISNLQVVEGLTTAQITWNTDEPATSRVDFGGTTGYGSVVEDLTLKTSHVADLSGLSAATLYHFLATSADAEGLPAVSGDQVFTTLAANVPPVISNVQVTTGAISAQITWDTDEPATTRVDFGETTGYGTVFENLTLTTAHVAPLSGLTATTLYHYQLTSTDVGALSAVTADATFTTNSAVIDNSGIASDDFNGCILDPLLWTLVDPLGGATAQIVGAGTGSAQLQLYVPPGASHNPWTSGNDAVRLMQPVNDADFEVETKIDSALTQTIQSHGLLVEESATKFLRFDAYRNGSNVRLFAAVLNGGSAATKLNDTISSAAPLYLRINRTGTDWTLSYSSDGQAWVTATTFADTLVPTQVGVMGGNSDSSGAAPEHNAVFDYFFNNASPIVSEDQGAVPTDLILDVTSAGNGTVLATPSLPTYLCGAAVTVDATADPGYQFVQWTGDVSSTDNPLNLAMTKNLSITATFGIGNPPPVISNLQVTTGDTTAQITWDTDEPATTRVDFGETTGYGSVYEDLALNTSHTASLTGLSASTLYHFQATSTDAEGAPTATADQSFTTQSINVPPVISNVQVTTGTTTAQITWDTDEPATSRVDFGETTSYGSVFEDLTLKTSHVAPLNGLIASTLYHYQITSADAAALPTVTADAVFTTQDPVIDNSGIVSDDFNGCTLHPTLWTLVDPLGGATAQLVGAGTGDAQLEIFVPPGSSHNPWTPTNTAVRLMQPVNDDDFEIEAKLDSNLAETIQLQGLLIEESDGHFLRFDAYRTGGSVRLLAAVISGGSASTEYDEVIVSTVPLYLRANRIGDDWTLSYSSDGQIWTTAITFAHVMAPTQVGVMGGNFSGSGVDAPAHTAVFDYFFNNASPIVSEDQAAVPTDLVLTLGTAGNGTAQATPSAPTYLCGAAVTLDATPAAGGTFAGWTGDVTSADNPLNLVMTKNLSVTANFVGGNLPPVISNVQVSVGATTAQITWDTDEPATTRVDFGETTGYGSVIEDLTLVTSHVAALSSLNSATQHHFQLTATDAGGLSDVTADDVFSTTGGGQGPVFDIWYGANQTFGQAGQAQLDTNLMGNVDDPDNVAELYYSLNGAPERQLSIGPNGTRLALRGDFNADIGYSELLVGANLVTLRAVDGLGNESIEVITLNFAAGNVPSMDYTVDWSAAAEISDVAQVVDGNWSLPGAGVTVVERGYDRLIALGDVSWDNYEVVVPITVHEIRTPTSPGPGVGVGVRWGNHGEFNPGEQPPAKWFDSMGSIAMWRTMSNGDEIIMMWGSNGSEFERQPRPFELQKEYTFKMRAETLPDGSHEFSFKMWDSTLPEPAGWDIVNNEPNGQQTNGSVLLIAHHADATFGNVIVTPIGQ